MPIPTQYVSNYGFLGFSVKEAAFGTATAATLYFKFESETFETDPGFKPVPTIGGTRAENNLSYGDEIHAAGGVVLPFGPLNGPALLAYALGTDTLTHTGSASANTLASPTAVGDTTCTLTSATGYTAGEVFSVTSATTGKVEIHTILSVATNTLTLAAGEAFGTAFAASDATAVVTAQVHTMMPNESGIPSFTVEKNLGGLTSQQYAGCIVNKFDLEAMTNAPCRATLDLLPQIDVAPFSATTPSYVADTPFALANYSVALPVAGVLTANTNVLRIKLSIDNGAKGVFTFSGKRYATLNYSSARIITGEVEVILQSMSTQYTDAMAGTYGKLAFLMSQGSTAFCAFTCPAIQWGKPQQALRRGELITQVLPFTVFYLAGQTYDLKAVIGNTVSTSYLA